MPVMATPTLSIQPAMSPPAGVTSNFDNPPSRASMVHTVMSVCLGLATLLVLVRIYTRARIAKPLWWDDLVSVLAWIFFIGPVWAVFLALDNGGGVDIWNVPKTNYSEFNKFWKNIMILARIDITLAKVAILLLFLRLFTPRVTGHKQMWFWLWFMIVFNCLYCLVLILIIQLQCIRRKDPPPNGSCLNQQLLIIGASVINVITEIAILAVPIFTVRGLRLPLSKKIGIVAILSFGTAGIALSMARLIWQATTTNTNPTVYNMNVIMLATGETTVAIMTGCMPTLPAFYKYHFQRHVTQVSAHLSSSEGSGRTPKHPKVKPFRDSTTELVSTDVQLETLR